MAEDVALSGSDKVELSGSAPGAGADLLRREYEECLDALAEVRREEAMLAARKVQLVARCAGVTRAVGAPGMSLQGNHLTGRTGNSRGMPRPRSQTVSKN
jgi:hypothetical protein